MVYKAEWRSKQVAVKFFNQKNIGDVTSFIREVPCKLFLLIY